jgi:hypothetical protein
MMSVEEEKSAGRALGIAFEEREKRTTEHPVAYSLKPDKPPQKYQMDVSRRVTLIAAISGAMAALVKRTLYPTLIKWQPKQLPVTFPKDFGFFVAGSATTSLALMARQKSCTTRRSFLYSMSAGLGAAIGAKLGDSAKNLESQNKSEYTLVKNEPMNTNTDENSNKSGYLIEQICDQNTEQITPFIAPTNPLPTTSPSK